MNDPNDLRISRLPPTGCSVDSVVILCLMTAMHPGKCNIKGCNHCANTIEGIYIRLGSATLQVLIQPLTRLQCCAECSKHLNTQKGLILAL